MSDFADLSSRVVAGAVAGDLVVTGIKANDRIVLVQDLTAGVSDLSAEFTVKADNTLNNTGGTSTNAHTVLVVWERKWATREKFGQASQRTGRAPF